MLVAEALQLVVGEAKEREHAVMAEQVREVASTGGGERSGEGGAAPLNATAHCRDLALPLCAERCVAEDGGNDRAAMRWRV